MLDSLWFHHFYCFHRTTGHLWVVASGLLIRFEGRFSLFCSWGCLLIVASWLKSNYVTEEVTSSLLLAALLTRDQRRTRAPHSRSRCYSRIVAFFGMTWCNLFKVHMSDDD